MQWKCGHCKQHSAKCSAERVRLKTGEASDGPADNPLNAEVLIKRTIDVLKTYKSKNDAVQQSMAVCVQTLVNQDMLEKFFKERLSFTEQFKDIVELYLGVNTDAKRYESTMQSFKTEEFVDAVYAKVLRKMTELHLEDTRVTNVPEADISQAIMDTASQYLDEVRTRFGDDECENTDDECENTEGMQPVDAFIKGRVAVHDEHDSDSGESVELSNDSDSEKDPDEKNSKLDTHKNGDDSDELSDTDLCEFTEKDVHNLQVEFNNIHDDNDKEESEMSEDPLDVEELPENRVNDEDYTLISELGSWDFSRFFNTVYILMNTREILLRKSNMYNHKTGHSVKQRGDTSDIWQRVIEAVYTSKATLIRHFLTIQRNIFEELYPACTEPYGSLTFPHFQCDGYDIQMTPLHNFNKHLAEKCLFREMIQKLMIFFVGIKSHGSRHHCEQIYVSTLKANDSEIAEFPSTTIHDSTFWSNENNELSAGVNVYVTACEYLIKRYIASTMELDENKFHEPDYKPHYQEGEVGGTQPVEKRMRIRSSEIDGMVEDNVDMNSSRKCRENSGKGIVAIWLAVEIEYKKAISSDELLKKELDCRTYVASGSHSKGKQEHREGSASPNVMKQYSDIWLLLCFLHCVNARIGTLYYLFSGKPMSEDFECDKKHLQDASYTVINGYDFMIDFKNATSNAAYFAREMCDRESDIHQHSLDFFFNPDDEEESRYDAKESSPRLQDFMRDSKKHLIEDCGSLQSCIPVCDIQNVLLEMKYLNSRFQNISESLNEASNVFTPQQKNTIIDMSVGMHNRTVLIFGLYKHDIVTEKTEPKSKTVIEEENSLKNQLAIQTKLNADLKLQMLGLNQELLLAKNTPSMQLHTKSQKRVLPDEMRKETQSIDLNKRKCEDTPKQASSKARAETRRLMIESGMCMNKSTSKSAGGGSSSQNK